MAGKRNSNQDSSRRKSSKRTHNIQPHAVEAISSSTQTVTRKEVIGPKVLDTQYFVNNEFDFITILKNLELTTFLEIKKPVYPDVVREFYSNLSLQKGVVTSEVVGIEIKIEQTLWQELTTLPCDGLKFGGDRPSKEWVISTKFDKLKAKASLLRDDSPLKGTTAGYLHTENRLLHYALVTGLLPRSSNHAYLMDKDVFPIWTMLNGITINWGYYVMNHMPKAAKTKSGGLPYAMFLTKIFGHFDVPLDQQEKEDAETYKMFGQGILSSLNPTKKCTIVNLLVAFFMKKSFLKMKNKNMAPLLLLLT
ncbi:hypothetical protein Fmac_021249 [Flemingia macrophylla]|uniref:Putative plant transposon protein domain-containing protein n=1 Tax=Flemingia macrophylla TaxID=520843 RepID=A0ABD1LWA9_9FABA